MRKSRHSNEQTFLEKKIKINKIKITFPLEAGQRQFKLFLKQSEQKGFLADRGSGKQEIHVLPAKLRFCRIASING